MREKAESLFESQKEIEAPSLPATSYRERLKKEYEESEARLDEAQTTIHDQKQTIESQSDEIYSLKELH